MDSSPQGYKKPDTAEQLSTHACVLLTSSFYFHMFCCPVPRSVPPSSARFCSPSFLSLLSCIFKDIISAILPYCLPRITEFFSFSAAIAPSAYKILLYCFFSHLKKTLLAIPTSLPATNLVAPLATKSLKELSLFSFPNFPFTILS